MSYFAILHDDPNSIEVTHCHINLWRSHPRIRRPFLLIDIGLGLRNAKLDSPKLQIALPCRATEAQDISERLEDQKTASLVFGTFVVSPTRRQITNRAGTINFSLAKCELSGIDGDTGKGSSIWNLNLLPPLNTESNGITYVRTRFSVLDGGSAWIRDGRREELFDFRIADARGVISDGSQERDEGRIVKLNQMNAFVIAPSFLNPLNSHPDFKYVRVLEAKVWGMYLKPLVSSFRGKMIVRHWKIKEEIGPETPYQAFVQLNDSRNGTSTFGAVGLAFLGAILALAAVSWLPQFSWMDVTARIDDYWTMLLVGSAILSIVIAGLQKADWVRNKIGKFLGEKLRRGKLR